MKLARIFSVFRGRAIRSDYGQGPFLLVSFLAGAECSRHEHLSFYFYLYVILAAIVSAMWVFRTNARLMFLQRSRLWIPLGILPFVLFGIAIFNRRFLVGDIALALILVVQLPLYMLKPRIETAPAQFDGSSNSNL